MPMDIIHKINKIYTVGDLYMTILFDIMYLEQ
nr:MAG TPA: hypothetical protein [Caudoviricetes sp.]